MFNDLQGLGYGLVVFAVIIGVGTVILVNFGGSVANCASGFTYNSTLELCSNVTDTATPTGNAYTNTNYLTGQLGESGLAGWAPAIIAVAVGVLFLGAFIIKGSGKGRY